MLVNHSLSLDEELTELGPKPKRGSPEPVFGCRGCDVEKPRSAFGTRHRYGAARRRSRCLACERAEQKARAAERVAGAQTQLSTHDGIQEWRQIPGWPGFEVSSLGNVRRRVNRGKSRLHQYSPMAIFVTEAGYKVTHLRRKKCLIHRLIYSAFKGPLINGMHVCHLDGNRLNNSVENLLQVSPSENNRHKTLHGTMAQGERHYLTRYTDEKITVLVADIQKAPRSPTGRIRRGTLPALAEKHGVGLCTVQHIAGGRSWKHVS